MKVYVRVRPTTLNKRRYTMYTRSISRSSLSSWFRLDSVPPPKAATKFQFYIAVQQWMGKQLTGVRSEGRYCSDFRSASSVNTCAAYHVMQDRLSEDTRLSIGRVVLIARVETHRLLV